MSDTELLKFAIENGMLDTALVQEKIEMQKRAEILKNHQYKIWQASNGRWRTYLPDDSRKEGRRPIAKSTLEKLQEEVIKFYRQEISEKTKVFITIENLYPEWLAYKDNHSGRSTYAYRLDKDWERFYKREEVSKKVISKPISDVTKIELDNWAHELCKKHNMTKKCYYNMSHIMRGILDYAVDKGIVEENLFRSVKFNKDLFKKKAKPKSETQVFSKEEEQLLIAEAYRSYSKDPENILYMMVPTFFYTGVRLGELSALEWKDVHDDYIYIHQMYGREEKLDENGEWEKTTFGVVDSLKLNAEPREVIVTSDVHEVFKVVKRYYWQMGRQNERYVFTDREGKLPHPSTVDSMFYRLCRRVGIPERSPHKTRKTYISTLIDNGVNINFIREQVGHENEKTTYESYCFNRSTRDETKEQLRRALS